MRSSCIAIVPYNALIVWFNFLGEIKQLRPQPELSSRIVCSFARYLGPLKVLAIIFTKTLHLFHFRINDIKGWLFGCSQFER